MAPLVLRETTRFTSRAPGVSTLTDRWRAGAGFGMTPPAEHRSGSGCAHKESASSETQAGRELQHLTWQKGLTRRNRLLLQRGLPLLLLVRAGVGRDAASPTSRRTVPGRGAPRRRRRRRARPRRRSAVVALQAGVHQTGCTLEYKQSRAPTRRSACSVVEPAARRSRPIPQYALPSAHGGRRPPPAPGSTSPIFATKSRGRRDIDRPGPRHRALRGRRPSRTSR